MYEQIIKELIYAISSFMKLKETKIKMNSNIFKDLGIYGDDLEQIIYILDKKFHFKYKCFFNRMEQKGFWNEPEVAFPFFKRNKKKYLTVKDIILIIEECLKNRSQSPL